MTGPERPDPPQVADELATATGFLDWLRATVQWRTDGLDEQGLRAALHPTTMTLAGLLKHLAFVEDYWFGYVLAGHEPAEPWRTAPWDDDDDWEWHSAAQDSSEELRSLWNTSVNASRRLCQGRSPDDLAVRQLDGQPVSLRWILLHLIQEYARHLGHADLLREAVDGQTGE